MTTLNTTDIEQERAAFEAWVKQPNQDGNTLMDDGEYIYPKVAAAWEAWQARAESTPTTQLAALTEKLAAAEAREAKLRESLDYVLTSYESLLNLEDGEAAKCKAEGDMYGTNFHQGVHSGAIQMHIFMTKLIAAIKSPSDRTALDQMLAEARRDGSDIAKLAVGFRNAARITEARANSEEFWKNADAADADEIDLEESLARLKLFSAIDALPDTPQAEQTKPSMSMFATREDYEAALKQAEQKGCA